MNALERKGLGASSSAQIYPRLQAFSKGFGVDPISVDVSCMQHKGRKLLPQYYAAAVTMCNWKA